MAHISPEALAVVGSLLAPPVSATQERKSSKEGKSYSWYTSLGGVGKGALPLGERTKLIATLDGTVTILRLNNKDHYWVDAILFLTTQHSPTLRVRSPTNQMSCNHRNMLIYQVQIEYFIRLISLSQLQH